MVRREQAVPKDVLPRKSHELSKTHRTPTQPAFDRVVLLLQGGGALGAYQAGVYEALAEADLHPDWVAGISIGAINAAIIAGNAPELRVEKLRRFWEGITSPPFDFFGGALRSPLARGESARGFLNQMSAVIALMSGASGFFRPRIPNPWFHPPGTVEATSFYDTLQLKATLEALIDFDRVNSDHAKPATQSRRRQCAERKSGLFQLVKAGDQARARDGERRVAARLSGGRDRGRTLLGRGARLKHAASVDCDDATPAWTHLFSKSICGARRASSRVTSLRL